MEDKDQKPRIIVYGTYNDIHDNTYYGGKHYYGEKDKEDVMEQPKKDIKEYTINELREIVNKVMPMVGDTYSYFFSVIKVFMWKGRIPDHDFEKGVALVNELYPDWHLGKKEQYALARYDADSFYKAFDRWDKDDAPVGGKAYETYHTIAKELLKLL